ncbi:unnamed protein product [Rhizopus stolonifer]
MAIHQENLKTWKEQGCLIIGHARKSVYIPPVKDAVRIKNIQDMIDILHKRSGSDRVYVSPCTNSIEPIVSRDMNANKDMLLSLHQCSGNVQDMLKYICVQNEPVVIVCLTYAGLTTGPNDLKEFIKYHKNITHIVVDDNAYNNQFRVHSRDEILNKPCIAGKFKCRTSVGQRSNLLLCANVGSNQFRHNIFLALVKQSKY